VKSALCLNAFHIAAVGVAVFCCCVGYVSCKHGRPLRRHITVKLAFSCVSVISWGSVVFWCRPDILYKLLLTILMLILLPLQCRLDKRFVNITGDNLVVDDYRIAINEDSEQGTCIVWW
jgi:hypothetical protein